MNTNAYKKLIIAVFCMCIVFGNQYIFANTLNEVHPKGLAVSLVIDTSGSMEEIDPQRLRETAANIFIDLLSADDYISIITFADNEQVLLPMQKIKNSENKTNYKKILSQSLKAVGYTDFILPLAEASRQLSSVNEQDLHKIILFITDGEPISDNNENVDSKYMNSLWKEVENLSSNNYSVYSVGLSKDIDASVLEIISNDTKGSMIISDNLYDISSFLFNILNISKISKGFLNRTFERTGYFEFNLDEYTKEATLVFTNQSASSLDVSISAPTNIPLKNIVSVSRTDEYILYKINKSKELTGKWKVDFSGNGTINVLGNKVNTVSKDIKTDIVSSTSNRNTNKNAKPMSLLLNLKNNKNSIILFLLIITGLSILVILIGSILYKFLIFKNTRVNGKLLYWHESDYGNISKLEFNKRNKNIIVISFNDRNKDADYHIFNNQYDYDIIFSIVEQKSSWKFIDGYKVLFKKYKTPELFMKTTEPGIFIYENKIFTCKKIYKNDVFKTGGYIFQYHYESNTPEIHKGKDLFEKSKKSGILNASLK